MILFRILHIWWTTQLVNASWSLLTRRRPSYESLLSQKSNWPILWLYQPMRHFPIGSALRTPPRARLLHELFQRCLYGRSASFRLQCKHEHQLSLSSKPAGRHQKWQMRTSCRKLARNPYLQLRSTYASRSHHLARCSKRRLSCQLAYHCSGSEQSTWASSRQFNLQLDSWRSPWRRWTEESCLRHC